MYIKLQTGGLTPMQSNTEDIDQSNDNAFEQNDFDDSIKEWSRIDCNCKAYLTTKKHGPQWNKVIRRKCLIFIIM